jgi:sodium-dependent phosphate transporter
MAPRFNAGRLMLPCAVLAATAAMVMSKQIDAPNVGVPWQYKGLITWAFFWAFLDAYSIGANDLANGFANAVASGTLTHKGACCIAAIFEIVGAIALGSNVSDTIRGKLVEVKYFYKDPYVLSLGMSFANVGSGAWVIIATLLGLPVSTTHAIVGAVLGIGLVSFGPDACIWVAKDGSVTSSSFSSIVASWFISPVLSGCLSAIFYLAVKYGILLVPDDLTAVKRGILLMPAYMFFVFGVIWGFLFIKGIPALSNVSLETVLIPSVFGIAFAHAILGFICVSPWLSRTIIDRENLPWYTMPIVLCVPKGKFGYFTGDYNHPVIWTGDQPPTAEDVAKSFADPETLKKDEPTVLQPQIVTMGSGMTAGFPQMIGGPMGLPYQQQPMMMGFPMQPIGQPVVYGGYPMGGVPVMGSAFGTSAAEGEKDGLKDRIGKVLFAGMYDEELGQSRAQDAEMHAAAFQRSSMVEDMFMFLQLSTCCFFALSHGANDVANAVGPFSTVWMVYETGLAQSSKAPTPTWILVYGGLSIDIGIMTMGQQIMKALGNRLTLQSPSRGFCIELGAMFTVMIASKLGIPVSTTHSITGSTVFVGLCNGNLKAVNWKMFGVIYGGWIITCPAAGVMTALPYWAVAAAPRPLEGNGFWTGKVPA